MSRGTISESYDLSDRLKEDESIDIRKSPLPSQFRKEERGSECPPLWAWGKGVMEMIEKSFEKRGRPFEEWRRPG